MQEQFATFGQSLYPEYTGGKKMAEKAESSEHSNEESGKGLKAQGETREREKKGAKEKERRAVGKKETLAKEQEKVNELAREAKARIDEAKQKGKQSKVEFGQVKDQLVTMSRLQDGRSVVNNPQEIEQFERVLMEYGHLKAQELARLTPAQKVVLFQRVIREIGVANMPSATKGSGETLAIEKVADLLTVEEFGKAAERGGPGTMEAGPERWAEGDVRDTKETIRRLLQLARSRHNLGVDEFNRSGLNADWDRLTGHLNERISQVEQLAAADFYREVFELDKIIKDAVYLAEHPITPPAVGAPTDIELLSGFLPAEKRRDIMGLQQNLHNRFGRIYDDMNDETRRIVLGDFEVRLQNLVDQLRIGLTLDQLKIRIFGGQVADPDTGEISTIPGLIRRGEALEPWIEGIREWRATIQVDGVETHLGIDLLTQPPARWQEVPERLANIYRFIEATDFSVEQLSTTIQKAVQMLETVQRNQPEGRELLARLNKELKAFQAFHSFRVQMERTAMHPEEVTPIFKSYFDDETWAYFVARFAKDSRERKFIFEEEGKEVEVNLFDVATKLYFKQLHSERLRMNKIQEMSKRELNFNSDDFDQQWIILRLALEEGDFKDFIKGQNNGSEIIAEGDRDRFRQIFRDKIRGLDKDQRAKVEAWGKNVGSQERDSTKEVVRAWYEENTLLGSLKHLGVRRKEMRQQLSESLRGLQVKGTDKISRQVDLEELRNSGFLDSVDYNAYYFVWTMGWSDHDIIRLYGREAAGKADPMIKAVAYNESSFMWWGRHVDHVWEFFTDELRGRSAKENEVNEIMRKAFPGKNHDLFARNRTMVRFFNNFTTEEQRRNLRVGDKNIDELINELMEKNDFSHADPQYREWFRNWAEGIIRAELIDEGKISFDVANFSANPIEKAQYTMADLFSDRDATAKYLSRDMFQNYLIQPTEGKFIEINDQMSNKFYSGRVIRIWPFMTLALRAHWKFASEHRLRIFDDDNLVAAEGEPLVAGLISNGSMERKQGEHEMRQLFGFHQIGPIPLGEWAGTLPFRRARQYSEAARRIGWDSRFLIITVPVFGFFAGLWELVRQLPAAAIGQVQGK